MYLFGRKSGDSRVADCIMPRIDAAHASLIALGREGGAFPGFRNAFFDARAAPKQTGKLTFRLNAERRIL